MSEYYMSHTGEELDDAINKVRSGYILPTETINIIENVSNMDISNGKFLNVNVPVPEGYIKPSGNSPTITTNGTHNVRQYENAVVNVPIPSGYIKTSDTQNYTTKFASGTFSVTADTLVANASISVGFKPKIFVIRSNSGITSTSSRFYITTSWVVTDNNFEYILSKPDGTTDVRASGSIGFYHQSTPSVASRSAQSNGVNNSFLSSDNGVKGNGSTGSSYYFKANITYFWFAWG